jgi:fructose-bisphosphate aldolase class II
MLCNPLQSRKVLQHALENEYAILAVNADSHASIHDWLEAARQINAPVIIETSLWQIKGLSFGAGDPVLGVAQYLTALALLANGEKFKSIPVIYHTDHIKGPDTVTILERAILGIPLSFDETTLLLKASTVSLDASEFTEDENIGHILNLCSIAQSANTPVTLEMESAVDEGITSAKETEKLLGSVEEKFPGHIHLWAPGVGTKHGFGDNMNFTPATITMHRKLTHSITGREIGIALHGSTGLSHQDLRAAAKAGVVKVNWSTESLLIRSEAAREYYTVMSEKFNKKHPDWKNTVMDNGVNSHVSKSYMPKVAERMTVLGGEGKAASLYKSLMGPKIFHSSATL